MLSATRSLQKLINGLEKEGPVSSLYHENLSKNNSTFHNNIKMNDTFPLSLEKTTSALLDTLKLDDNLERDKEYHNEITSQVISKQAFIVAMESFLKVTNRCVAVCVFPNTWHQEYFKNNPTTSDKPPEDRKPYRPNTLLPSMIKLLER